MDALAACPAGDPGAHTLVVRAPVRVDFAGGPSDMAPFCADEWGYVANAAIARHATVQVRARADSRVVLRSDDLQVAETYPSVAALRHDTPLRLLTTALALTGISTGIEIAVRLAVPAGAGLGGSAAVSVALLYALRTLRGETAIDRAALAQAAIGHETGTLQNPGGGQDQYAAAFGGFQGFHFSAAGVTRRALAVPLAARQALEAGLLLCYSGTSRISGAVLGAIMARYQARDAAVTARLRHMRALALAAEDLLAAGDLAGLGACLTADWADFCALHPGVDMPAIARILAIGRDHGAYGGKATGAGGGGCVLLAVDPARRPALATALTAASFPVFPFTFAASGVEGVWERAPL